VLWQWNYHSFKNIRSFAIGGIHVDTPQIPTEITKLKLSDMKLPENLFSQVPNLTSLSLHRVQGTFDLCHLSDLKELKLVHNQLSHDKIPEFPKLERLWYHETFLRVGWDARMNFDLISKCPNLRNLTCGEPLVLAVALPSVTKLESLTVPRCALTTLVPLSRSQKDPLPKLRLFAPNLTTFRAWHTLPPSKDEIWYDIW
jgi:hypothetical protein